MRDYDFEQFSVSWIMAQEVTAAGRTISGPAMELIFNTLDDCPLDMVLSALKIHVKQNNFAPTVCGIREIIAEMSGNKHLGADEAWNIALVAFDENESVVWTKEICEAKIAAQPSFDVGDMIGARMAFKDAYNRKIAFNGQVKWIVSPGYDKTKTAQVVQDAIHMNRLSIGTDSKYIQIECTTNTTKLIEEAAKQSGNDDVLENIQKIKKMITSEQKDDDVAVGIASREKEREEYKKAVESYKYEIITDAMKLLDDQEAQLYPF